MLKTQKLKKKPITTLKGTRELYFLGVNHKKISSTKYDFVRKSQISLGKRKNFGNKKRISVKKNRCQPRKLDS